VEQETQRWGLGPRPDLGLIDKLNGMLRGLGAKRPPVLPDLSRGRLLFAASDYSGEHAGAPYQAYSIILADLSASQDWELSRRSVRARWLADGRRVSYKALRDRHREAALPHFLQAADRISGLLLTVLVDSGIDNMFHLTEDDRHEESLGSFANWPRSSLEKLLRIVHFLSLLIAGLSRPGQDLLWITDEDEIAANEQRLKELVFGFSNVASHYLTHSLGHLRIGTTRSDTGLRDVEDFTAIPDLVAGAAADSFGRYHGVVGWPPPTGIIVPSPPGTPGKATIIMSWYARDANASLKRLIYLIDRDRHTGKQRVSALRLHPSGLTA